MNQKISRDEINARLNAGDHITIVEALPERYYNAEHLPGAINIPHDAIRERAASALPDKDATIVVYCANTECQNSKIATQALMAMDYRNVLEYVEGKKDWKDAGLPLRKL